MCPQDKKDEDEVVEYEEQMMRVSCAANIFHDLGKPAISLKGREGISIAIDGSPRLASTLCRGVFQLFQLRSAALLWDKDDNTHREREGKYMYIQECSSMQKRKAEVVNTKESGGEHDPAVSISRCARLSSKTSGKKFCARARARPNFSAFMFPSRARNIKPRSIP